MESLITEIEGAIEASKNNLKSAKKSLTNCDNILALMKNRLKP